MYAGAVPQLVTAWQGVSRAECDKAFEKAAAEYNKNFQVKQACMHGGANQTLPKLQVFCSPHVTTPERHPCSHSA